MRKEKTTANPPKKTKEQIKKEELINKALFPTSRRNVGTLGILGVDPGKAVFCIGPRTFVRVVRLVHTGDVLASACKAGVRLRVTSFMDLEGSEIFYLAIYAEGETYAECTPLFDDICQRVCCVEADINEVFNQAISATDPYDRHFHLAADKNKAWHDILFPQFIEHPDCLEYPAGDKDYRLTCFVASGYQNTLGANMAFLKDFGYPVIQAIDICPISRELAGSFEALLESKYNHKCSCDFSKIINLSYMLAVRTDNESHRQMACKAIINQAAKAGVSLTPQTKITQWLIIEDLLTCGIRNYQITRNTDINIANTLLTR